MTRSSDGFGAGRWRSGVLLFALALLAGCDRLSYSVDAVNFGTQGVILLKFGTFEAQERGISEGKTAAGERIRYGSRAPGLDGIPMVAELNTMTPTLMDSPATPFGRFPGYSKSLPDRLEVTWQLANLRGCKDVFKLERPEDSQRYQFMLEHLKARKRSPEDEERLLKVALANTHWAKLEALGHEDPGKYIRQRDCTWEPIEDDIHRQVVDLKAIRETDAYRRTGRRNPSAALSKFVLRLTFVFENEKLEVKAESYTTNPWS